MRIELLSVLLPCLKKQRFVSRYRFPILHNFVNYALTHWPQGAGRCWNNCKSAIAEHKLRINFLSISFETAFSWMSQNIFDDKSTLVQVMAWCRQRANVITWYDSGDSPLHDNFVTHPLTCIWAIRFQWVFGYKPTGNGSFLISALGMSQENVRLSRSVGELFSAW